MKRIFLQSLFIIISISIFAQIPTSFDLRNVDGVNYVSSVKSQQGGTCWTHGSMASMEGNLMMTSNWTANGEAGDPNLAEYHLDWWNGYNQYYNQDLDNPYNNGQGLEVHMGGDYRVTTAYMSRLEGAVRDTDGQSYNSPPDHFSDEFHIYYPKRVEWYNAGDDLSNIDLIKEKIMEHGVMAICMCYDGSFMNGYNHYQPASSSLDPNHSISIIGWDDNHSTQAPNNGAWLVKNSWGTGWGYSGYFWIAYEDKHACKNPEMGAISFIDVDIMDYDTAYYHDYHGWRDTLTFASQAFNAFQANDDEDIVAVSFFTAENNVSYTVKIFAVFTDGILSEEKISHSGNIEFSGLHTIDLPQNVSFNNDDKFYVFLELSNGGHPYDRTSDVPVLLGASSRAIVPSTANEYESYYKLNNIWLDLYQYNDPSGFQNTGNFCIKAIANHQISLGTTVSINPENQTVNTSEVFNTTVEITDVQDLGSFELELTFNSALLQANSVTIGDFLGSTGRQVFPLANHIDNTTGLLEFAATTLGASPPGPNGDGILMNIEWTSTDNLSDEITTDLFLQNLQITEPNGTVIPINSQNATVTITPCYQHDFDCDCDVDIVDVTLAAYHYGTSVGDTNYDATYDLDSDGDIDIVDITMVTYDYGWNCTGKNYGTINFDNTNNEDVVLGFAKTNLQNNTNGSFQIELFVENIDQLGGYELEIGFNADELQVINTKQGSFIESTGRETIPLQSNINNTLGIINFSTATLGADINGANGTGSLIVLNCKALQTNFEIPTLMKAQLVRIDAAVIDYSFKSVEIEYANSNLSYIVSTYPSPFKESMTLLYHLGEEGQVSFKIFNVKGEQIKASDILQKTKGNYEKVFNNINLSTGIYLISLEQNGKTIDTKRIIVE